MKSLHPFTINFAKYKDKLYKIKLYLREIDEKSEVMQSHGWAFGFIDIH